MLSNFLSAFISHHHLLPFFSSGMASNDRDTAAAHLSHDEAGGDTSAKSHFLARETVLHWYVAKCRRLYPNTPDLSRYGAVFRDGRNFTMFDRLWVRRDTDLGA